MGITIRQYAKSRHVSYEAVRRQILRYEEELSGHTERKNNAVYLDDAACDFLDTHRQKKTIILSDDGKTEIDLLKSQIENLKHENNALKDKIMVLQDKQTSLIEDNAKNKVLLDIADKEHKELESVRSNLISAQKELEISKITNTSLQNEKDHIQQELDKYHKTWFGLYKKD